MVSFFFQVGSLQLLPSFSFCLLCHRLSFGDLVILGHPLIFKGSEQIGSSGFVDYEIHRRKKKKRDSPKDDLARKICRIYRYHFGLLRFSREIFSNFLLQRYSPGSLQLDLIQKKHWGGVCVGCCQHSVYIL